VFERAGPGYRMDRFGDAAVIAQGEAEVSHESAKDEEHR
jgi:hypothetical protein